jgi:hypothetical protein
MLRGPACGPTPSASADAVRADAVGARAVFFERARWSSFLNIKIRGGRGTAGMHSIRVVGTFLKIQGGAAPQGCKQRSSIRVVRKF